MTVTYILDSELVQTLVLRVRLMMKFGMQRVWTVRAMMRIYKRNIFDSGT